jgi:hypothetical protein
MPTVLRIGGYRFHFYSDEGMEPPHIHARCAEGECKFWLAPIMLAKNLGLSPQQLRQVEQLVYANRRIFWEKFNEFHNNRY